MTVVFFVALAVAAFAVSFWLELDLLPAFVLGACAGGVGMWVDDRRRHG